jgi:hypothetical protein
MENKMSYISSGQSKLNKNGKRTEPDQKGITESQDVECCTDLQERGVGYTSNKLEGEKFQKSGNVSKSGCFSVLHIRDLNL